MRARAVVAVGCTALSTAGCAVLPRLRAPTELRSALPGDVRVVAAARAGRSVIFEVTSNDRLYRSVDGGRRWGELASPGGSSGGTLLAFANRRVGWLVTNSFHPQRGQAWVTHDSGAQWGRLRVRGASGLAATSQHVYLVAQGRMLVGSVANDAPVAIGPSVGSSMLVDHGVIYDYEPAPMGRSVVLRAVENDRIRTIATPCRRAFTTALTATPGGTLIIVCGSQPGAGNQLKQAFQSPDRGHAWQPATAPGEGGYVSGGAAGTAGAFLYGSRMELVTTSDGVHSWRVAVSGSGSANGVGPVGFNQGRYGWAVDRGPPTALYLTDDGGRSWRRAAQP